VDPFVPYAIRVGSFAPMLPIIEFANSLPNS